MAAREERDVVVIRNGRDVALSVHSLMVGDILRINEGDQLPADCILLNGNKVIADESSQTGETKDIEKESLNTLDSNTFVNPFLISGTMIKEGKGTAVVVNVGPNTCMGKIRSMMEEESEMTPLQRKLERIASGIGKIGIISGAVVTMALATWMIADGCMNGWNDTFIERSINIFIYGITIIVISVPSGLPLAVTLTLAYSVSHMKDENNLVRHIGSCEIMGGANNICSDKTGTLTKNTMTVMGLYSESMTVENDANAKSHQISKSTIKLLCESICVNSTASMIYDNKEKKLRRMGNATECALLSMAEEMGYKYELYRTPEKEMLVVPFNSKRKRMTTVWQLDEDPTKYAVYVKGAPELLLPSCTKIIAKGGEIVDLDEQGINGLNKKVLKRNAEIGYRSILLAYKLVDSSTFDPKDYKTVESYEKLETNLTIIAIVGIEDPLREGVKDAIKVCKNAGITVRMVTGDNIDYARSIAIQSGIITRNQMDPTSPDYLKYGVMLGVDFCNEVGGIIKVPDPENEGKFKDKVGDPEKFAKIERELKVLARSQPEHKYLLVTGLKENENNVIAVTGDGTNDAPALKKADIGFAMGITGTEIAKEASKIILLDDNFSSIVTALKWGRNIYQSIRKFLQFQQIINVVALTISIVSGIYGNEEPPINTVQMLWIDLIMDSLAALALATEPPSDLLLKDLPYGKNDAVLTKSMWRNIICTSVYQITILLYILFARPDWIFFSAHDKNRSSLDKDHYERIVNTVIFHTFVLMQIFNEVACRRIKSSEINVLENLTNNWRFSFTIAISLIVQIGIVESSAPGFNTHSLTWEMHGFCFLFGIGTLIWALICKKLIPESLFACVKLDESVFFYDLNNIKEMSNKEIMESKVLKLKRRKEIKAKKLEEIEKLEVRSLSIHNDGVETPEHTSPEKLLRKVQFNNSFN